MGHYAEAFAVIPGRCFRFTHAGTGHARHCPGRVVTTGTFRDGTGKRYRVEACGEHRGELEPG